MARCLRLENLIGRKVRAGNARVVGRLEEVRVERSRGHYAVTEYVLGPAGLWERLGLAASGIFGAADSGYVARWDQIDVSNPDRLQLTCDLADLRKVS